MLSSKCAMCGSKKLRFIEEQEAKGFPDLFQFAPL